MNDSSPYRDFSRATETDLLKLTPHCSDKKAAAAAQNFPMKLHYMLSEMEKDGQSHVISWNHHGRCFTIHDRKAIEKFLPL